MRPDFSYVGGRTFALTVGCGIATSLMRCLDKIDNSSFTTVILGTVGAYIGATTFQKHTEVRAEVQKSIAAKQAGASPPNVVQQVKE